MRAASGVCVCFFGCFRVVEKGGGKLGSWLDWWKEGPMVLGGCYSHWKGGEDFDPFPQICDPEMPDMSPVWTWDDQFSPQF